MSRKCRNSSDSFCYICGEFTTKAQKKDISPLVKKAYELYFGCKVGDQDKNWVPHVCCSYCSVTLTAWIKGTRKCMPFAVPMIWREQRDHTTDCYFCLTNVRGFSSKNKKSIKYPDLLSAMRPVPHDESLPVPKPPDNWTLDDDDASSAAETEQMATDDYTEFQPPRSNMPHLINQQELHDLVRDLGLSKKQSELLGSRLQEWNLLMKGTKISVFRKRQQDLEKFFDKDDNLCFCNNVSGLFDAVGHCYEPQEWRLFIDSSILSLKAVLLHNGNVYPSIPLAHAVHMKETYVNLQNLLRSMQYSTHQWNICGDLKVVQFSLACSKAIQSIVVYFASGTAGIELLITPEKSGHYVKI